MEHPAAVQRRELIDLVGGFIGFQVEDPGKKVLIRTGGKRLELGGAEAAVLEEIAKSFGGSNDAVVFGQLLAFPALPIEIQRLTQLGELSLQMLSQILTGTHFGPDQ